jgi:hypothetical protein
VISIQSENSGQGITIEYPRVSDEARIASAMVANRSQRTSPSDCLSYGCVPP